MRLIFFDLHHSLALLSIHLFSFYFKGLKEEVSCLNHKIHELETQNQALASMLVHQLRSDSPDSPADLDAFSKQCFLDDKRQRKISDGSMDATSPQTGLNIKHCNSFNSEVLEESPAVENCDNDAVSEIDKRLSADTANILGNCRMTLNLSF